MQGQQDVRLFLAVFKHLRDCLLVFSIFCLNLGHHKGTKETKTDFLKKILGVTNGGKTHFRGIFDVFVYISASSH